MQRLCSGTPATDALLAAGLSPTVADAAARVLLRLGFESALDLRLVVGEQLQTELAAELKANGLSIGDRAKIQLLVGHGSAEPCCGQQGGSAFAALNQTRQGTALIDSRGDSNALLPTTSQRREQQADGDGAGLSTDTLAIVLSVLVGAAGCESPFVGCNAIDVSVGG